MNHALRIASRTVWTLAAAGMMLAGIVVVAGGATPHQTYRFNTTAYHAIPMAQGNVGDGR